jgi:TolB-like protein/Tfp pilus assembly protein PilF
MNTGLIAEVCTSLGSVVSLISELKRRNVFRMAALYLLSAWLIMQVAEVFIDLARLPEWVGPAVLGLLAIGFPIALVLSWFYEISAAGIKLEQERDSNAPLDEAPGRRIDFIVISLLSAALILFAYDKWWLTPSPELSMAVLPFENMSTEPGKDYYSDGISEELLNVLGHYPGLRVAARTSSFQFKGKNQDINEIGEALNVSYVLEGSVHRSGDELQITAQLIDTADGDLIWSETYDGKLDDIFSVQDDITARIGEALKLRLGAGILAAPSVSQAADILAYDLYLQGREMLHLRDGDLFRRAVRLFERALRLDAGFAPAHAQLAISKLLMVQAGELALEDAAPIASAHLLRAQDLDPTSVDAHAGRTLLALFEDDPAAAIRHAKKALALNPHNADVMNWLQSAYRRQGEYLEADRILERTLVVDPLNLMARINYIERLNQTGQTGEAHRQADLLMGPAPGWAYYAHTETSLIYEGRLAEGLTWALKMGREVGGGRGYVTHVFKWIGEYEEARRFGRENSIWVDVAQQRWQEPIAVTQRQMAVDPNNPRSISQAANVLYQAGRIDEALPLLERAFALGMENRPLGVRLDHYLTMTLADARRHAGDEAGARAAADIVRRDHAARQAAGRKNSNDDLAGANLAAFDGDKERAIALLRSSVLRGLREPIVFDNPLFFSLQDEPDFLALKAEVQSILDRERQEVLQLICFNNPVPDDWRPLPETCEGVQPQS